MERNGVKARPWQKCRTLIVKRTWKRDGSTNLMYLEAALGAIKHSCPDLSYQAAFELLMRGALVSTRLAVYELELR